MSPTLGTSIASEYDAWAYQDRIGSADARYAMASLLMPIPNLTYISYRGGVFASGDTGGTGGSGHMGMRVQPGTGLVVTVEVGNCVIDTTSNGPYLTANGSRKTLPLAASSGTTNRIDLVIARVYDDQNSAIGSPAGTRQFTVEVWTGDGSTGTPSQPVPAPSAGWIPLAAVYVGKGASSISTANITDLRGPGLVARGGMRALYGTDSRSSSTAFAEAGAYPGDQRWVHAPGFQHQVFLGQGGDPTNSGWRGVFNCLRYFAFAPPGEYSFTAGYGVSREITRVTIPYPGTPFMVYPTAHASITLSGQCAADLRINIGDPSGPDINWTRFHTYGAGTDKLCVPNVAPMHYGPLTGTTDVVLSCGMRDNVSDSSGFGYRGNDGGANVLSVMVFPSTIQPPAT